FPRVWSWHLSCTSMQVTDVCASSRGPEVGNEGSEDCGFARSVEAHAHGPWLSRKRVPAGLRGRHELGDLDHRDLRTWRGGRGASGGGGDPSLWRRIGVPPRRRYDSGMSLVGARTLRG